MSLLKEAYIERKRRKLIKIQLPKSGKIDRIAVMKRLLPNYEPQPKQLEFHKSGKPDKYGIGGYGSGKTKMFSAEGIFLGYINRPYPVLLVTQTKGNVEVTTLEEIRFLCNDNGIEYREKEIATYTRFEMLFGDEVATLLIASGYSPKSLAGPTVAAAGIDEPFLQKKKTMQVVVGRARHPKAVINELFFTGTIEPLEMEWGFDIVDDDFKGDKETFKVVISTEENKYATNAFLRRLKRTYDPAMQEVYIHGKNQSLRGSVVYRYDHNKNRQKYSELKKPGKGATIMLGFDFNVDPMSAGEILLDGKIRRQIEEYIIHNSNTEELCELIIERLKTKYPGIDKQKTRGDYSLLITMDAAARQRKTSAKIGVTDALIIKTSFEQAGFMPHIHVPETNPPVRDRVNFVNNLFDKGYFVIADNCLESILDRKLTKWKQSAEGFSIDKSKGRSHISEGVDYALWATQKMVFDDEDRNRTSIRRGQKLRERS